MRTKKALINYLTEIIPQLIIMFLGFFKLKAFLVCLGEETLGIFQLFSQLLFYLSLLDGGAGTIIGYYLYKPISEKNNKSIGQILSAAIKFFTYVAIAVFVLGLILDSNIMFFMKDATISSFLVKFMFLLILVANVLSYFFIPYTLFLDAKQERYLYNLYFQPILIVKSIIEIFLVMYYKNLFVVLILQLILVLIQNVIVRIIFKKRYKEIKLKEKPDFEFIKKIKTIIPHKIGSIVSNNIDILIISKFLGVKQIVIYTSYYYIVDVLQKFVDSFASAVIPGIGNLLVTDEKKAYNLFKEYNEFLFYLATVLCIPLFMSISKFVSIWYGKNLVVNNYVVLVLVTLFFYRVIRGALGSFVGARGLFKETLKCVYLESAINLTLSIATVHYLGMFGVLFSTVISLIISEYLIKPRILNTVIFKEKKFSYYKDTIIMFLIYFILLGVSYYIIPKYSITNLLSWFVYSIIIFIINLIITTIIYRLIGKFTFFERIKGLIEGKLKHAKS